MPLSHGLSCAVEEVRQVIAGGTEVQRSPRLGHAFSLSWRLDWYAVLRGKHNISRPGMDWSKEGRVGYIYINR